MFPHFYVERASVAAVRGANETVAALRLDQLGFSWRHLNIILLFLFRLNCPTHPMPNSSNAQVIHTGI